MFGFKRIEETKDPWCLAKVSEAESKQYEDKVKVYLSLDVGIAMTLGTWYCVNQVVESFERGGYNRGVGGLAGCGIAVVFIVIHSYMPFFKKGEKKCASEPELGRARIRWYRIRQGGIGLPRLRLINNMIFPVCFVMADGSPVSQTLYVRIQKRYGLFWKNAKVRMAAVSVQDQNEERHVIWYRADKFYIYNNGEIIGEGDVVPSELKC